jgi:hypothetical protein
MFGWDYCGVRVAFSFADRSETGKYAFDLEDWGQYGGDQSERIAEDGKWKAKGFHEGHS